MEQIPQEFWWIGVILTCLNTMLFSVLVPAAAWAANWYKNRLDKKLELDIEQARKKLESDIEDRQDEREHRQIAELKILDYVKDFLKDIHVSQGEEFNRFDARIARIEATLSEDASIRRLLVIMLTDVYEKVMGKLPRLYTHDPKNHNDSD